MTELEGKTAIVTGGSSGIGRESANALAKAGADVTVAAPAEEHNRLEDFVESLEMNHGVETLVSVTDVSVEEEVTAMVERTAEEFGGIEIVVGNAGIGNPGSIDESTTEEYQRMMGVNVDGMYFTTRESLPYLRQSEGNLILMGSSSSLFPRPGSSIYAASKWWTRGFAHSISGTVGGDDVAVTLINPSATRTELIFDGKAPLKERYEPGEAIEPETVADAVRFAATQEPPSAVNELNIYDRSRLSDI